LNVYLILLILYNRLLMKRTFNFVSNTIKLIRINVLLMKYVRILIKLLNQDGNWYWNQFKIYFILAMMNDNLNLYWIQFKLGLISQVLWDRLELEINSLNFWLLLVLVRDSWLIIKFRVLRCFSILHNWELY